MPPLQAADISELHYIAPIANLRSILTHGLLSYRRAQGIPHDSVAMQEVQARRERKRVGGRSLHEYVNLYIHARNPMMYRCKEHHARLCVVRIGPQVMNQRGVVIADRNAAAQLTRFGPYPSGLNAIDRDLVFAEWWTHDDPVQAQYRKHVRCAEVLVPDQVMPSHFLGVYVSCPVAREKVIQARWQLPIEIKPRLFFQ